MNNNTNEKPPRPARRDQSLLKHQVWQRAVWQQ